MIRRVLICSFPLHRAWSIFISQINIPRLRQWCSPLHMAGLSSDLQSRSSGRRQNRPGRLGGGRSENVGSTYWRKYGSATVWMLQASQDSCSAWATSQDLSVPVCSSALSWVQKDSACFQAGPFYWWGLGASVFCCWLLFPDTLLWYHIFSACS